MFGFLDRENNENVFLVLNKVVLVKEHDDGTGFVSMVDGSWYNLIATDTHKLIAALKANYGNNGSV